MQALAQRTAVLATLARAHETTEVIEATKPDKSDEEEDEGSTSWAWANNAKHVGVLKKETAKFRAKFSTFHLTYITQPPEKVKKLYPESFMHTELGLFIELEGDRKALQREVDKLVNKHVAGQEVITPSKKRAKKN